MSSANGGSNGSAVYCFGLPGTHAEGSWDQGYTGRAAILARFWGEFCGLAGPERLAAQLNLTPIGATAGGAGDHGICGRTADAPAIYAIRVDRPRPREAGRGNSPIVGRFFGWVNATARSWP
jgi:hypothetical protein